MRLAGACHALRFGWKRPPNGQPHGPAQLTCPYASFAAHARSGANISATDPLGRTPLHLAAMLGHALTAGRLVIAGAAVARHDCDGYTPGHYAAMYGNAEVRRLYGKRHIAVCCSARSERIASSPAGTRKAACMGPALWCPIVHDRAGVGEAAAGRL